MPWRRAWVAPSTAWRGSRAPDSSSASRRDSRRVSTSSWPGSRRTKETIMADDRNDAAGYLGWFFLGGLIGAASALLLAPKTGREMRDQLLEHSNEFARRAQVMATEAQDRAGNWLDKSREVFEEQTQRLMSAFEAGKDAMRDEIRKGSAPPRA